tara:strand:- start:26039 stop:26680 length:642 start_codon:yes stop_codon:yes gene_type:complete
VVTKEDSGGPSLIKEVADYYTNKLSEFGETPQGVDWNSEAGQILRFQELCKVISPAEKLSLNDLGSGYGALFSYLNERYTGVSYFGYDVSEEMVEAARKRHAPFSNAQFDVAPYPLQKADYSVASGIFNVTLNRSKREWESYIRNVLDHLHESSEIGFSFNCLSSYSDKHKMREDLYYADPCTMFDHCKTKYSRHVALLHDYDLYEFTILVRK